ncbi:MAG TPA: hydrogenase maturation protease [Aestuariivirga sp.]|jgi:hydrogenase maturation protease|nr:hydrogenase maturation protease [Aestuariivirga sp.]
MDRATATPKTLVLGIGNSLLTDDGVGIHVIEALVPEASGHLIIRDGGTIGLALLPEIEDADQLIAVDAMELGEAPGTVRVFTGADMDRALSGVKRSAHEVALADLLMAAALSDALPERRALIGIQPDCLTWGLEPTPAVAAAVPLAVEQVKALAGAWSTSSAFSSSAEHLHKGRQASHV